MLIHIFNGNNEFLKNKLSVQKYSLFLINIKMKCLEDKSLCLLLLFLRIFGLTTSVICQKISKF